MGEIDPLTAMPTTEHPQRLRTVVDSRGGVEEDLDRSRVVGNPDLSGIGVVGDTDRL